MTTITCSAFLFDMDGTLVDSTALVEVFWRQWASVHDVDLEKLLATSHGYRTVDTIRLVAPHLDAEAEAARIEAEESGTREGIVAVPGAAELLAQLPPESWAVVTSATRELALARFEFAGLPRPRVLVSSGDVVHGKPHPEGFLKAAGLLGVSSADCLVVEDTPAGLKAGAAAGSKVLGISTTYPADVLPAETVVPHFGVVHLEGHGPFQLQIEDF